LSETNNKARTVLKIGGEGQDKCHGGSGTNTFNSCEDTKPITEDETESSEREDEQEPDS
jgi:hypothetical protein